ncbi:pyridoxal-phosphate dependent enzyme [Azospirillum sp. RWY-5-1]|uniref:Pyridoxal-phosphate dependent enzyme n=1 Tax=Azospirillum oleiclasticum TaxID=2735135 RepID=A0ABX2TJ39_9PROT|nr:pyridoxal-phosphate dependent enzyme [Azospirillum oleiclasticum]NYZ14584.1 pyridoxal-phosphate dependent enzyme [Azospirillum oleiclasticum]NYZ24362.1 pyridoxal-phosphate dependent enzyme [Azospirillum oleiclasticum]
MPFAHADLPHPRTASTTTRVVEDRLPHWLKPSAIDDAAERLRGHILRTPMLAAHELGRDVWLKAETFQATGAFKERGALNRLLRLTGVERARGVIAMSAGNHAAGLALHARRLGVRATIVMPTTAPLCKRERTETLGAEVILSGASVAEARAHALELAAERRLTFVHPYDDPDVIAGQGTVGLEILADRPDVATVVVPVGGGGLVAGVAAAVKAAKPSVTVVGVRLANRRGGTLADGIAVDALGKLAQTVVADLVDTVVEVSEAEVAFAMRTLHRACGVVTEGAGAAAVAALLAGTVVAPGCTVAVLSGRNVDPETLTRTLAAG